MISSPTRFASAFVFNSVMIFTASGSSLRSSCLDLLPDPDRVSCMMSMAADTSAIATLEDALNGWAITAQAIITAVSNNVRPKG